MLVSLERVEECRNSRAISGFEVRSAIYDRQSYIVQVPGDEETWQYSRCCVGNFTYGKSENLAVRRGDLTYMEGREAGSSLCLTLVLRHIEVLYVEAQLGGVRAENSQVHLVFCP